MNTGASPAFHQAFPSNVQRPVTRPLGSGNWETYDDIEEDLRAIQSDVIKLLGIDTTSTSFTRMEKLFEDVSFIVTYHNVAIEQASSVILNHLRFIVQQEMFHYQSNDEQRLFADKCLQVLYNINTCENNIWNHKCVNFRYDSFHSELHQYSAYINRNKAFFDSLSTWQLTFINNLIKWNRDQICSNHISAREGIRNVETYVNDVCCSSQE